MTRLCAWCENPIPARARRGAVCCSVRCRQARHRFLCAVGHAEAVAPGRPLRLAYADPPYPGKARLYRDHPDFGGEVDHAALIARLAGYDGWALSTSAEALPAVLALCPAGVRVAAWHRGERPTRSRWPLHAWEPVIYRGGRQLVTGQRRVDSLVCGVVPLDTLPGRVIGAKPAAVCRWIFTLLGAGLGDSLDDLFPGSGAVGRAWAAYTGQQPSPAPASHASCKARADASSPAASDTSYPSCKASHDRLRPATAGICPVTARTVQGMAPYPGQARCLALGFWPECFRGLNVKGGRRPFPEETRSALDIEGKHVTIQGPSPGPSPAVALAPSACATWLPSLLIRRLRQAVQDRLLRSMRWGRIPQPSTRDRPCPVVTSGLAAVLATVAADEWY